MKQINTAEIPTNIEVIEIGLSEETRINPWDLLDEIEEEEEEVDPVEEAPEGEGMPASAQTIIDTVKLLSDDELLVVAHCFRVMDEGINTLYAITHGYRRISNLT